MKIGIICYPTFGGSGVVATELGKALADRGHQVHFITYTQPVRLQHYHENIFYHEVIMPQYPLFEYQLYESALASKIVDCAQYNGLDVLHVHYAIPHATAAYLAKQILKTQGIYLPVITTLHGTDITLVGKDKAYASVVEFSINQSDGVTAVSESLKKETMSNFRISKPISVIPNFIDPSRFSKSNKEHFKKAIAPNGEKILIHISNFRPVKRVTDVVKIFQLVRKKISAKLLLVGDGPERGKVEQLCRDGELCNDVRFLGKQEPIEELLAISDLFLLPSETESFGLAALEAMACQVPVISTDAGGLPEINIHGETGFLSKVGEIHDMAKNAIYILEDDHRHTRLKQRAYQQAKRYDIALILPRYEEYYEKVVGKRQEYYQNRR